MKIFELDLYIHVTKYCALEHKSAYLIDLSIQSDSSLHLKFCEMIAKYSDLPMLIDLTYNLERVVILPVINCWSRVKSTLQGIVEDTDVMWLLFIFLQFQDQQCLIPIMIFH